MRIGVIFTAAVIAGGFGLAAPGHATGPAQAEQGWGKLSGLVQPAQYYRRYPPGYAPHPGYAPPVYAPPPQPGVVVQAPITGDVVVVPPPRPASCGEFHFWNGQACVDARYNKPYLGPRP